MRIYVANRRRSLVRLGQEFQQCDIIDVTSRGPQPWIKFSPFYPHGGIPVPFSRETSQTVEGVWQALKVFERADIDLSKLDITSMQGIKRGARKFGKVKGHRKGTAGDELLDYLEARRSIYLPTYYWLLDNCLQEELNQLQEKAKQGVVLLDYEINGSIEDLSKPLSHAQLIKQYLENFL